MAVIETKPRVLLKKYRSILLSALVVEAVTFLVSLTDSIVAANMVGMEAFTAIGLTAPFLSITTFVAAVINSGTVKNYTYQVGRFDKERANEYFSEGVIMAVISGVILLLIIRVAKGPFIEDPSVSESVKPYLRQYYDIILIYFLLEPISCLVDNIVVSDGGEKLSAVSNIIQVVGNVLLSFVLARFFGVRGIAIATVSCKAVFLILICLWFFGKKNTLRFKFRFMLRDCKEMIKAGVVRALTFAMTALMIFVLNRYILLHFDDNIFNVWVVVQKVLGLSSIFMGLSMTLQPLLGTLKGEKNTKAMRILSRRSCIDIQAAGLLLMAMILLFTPAVLRIFGMREGEAFALGVTALRITSLALVFIALTVFFFTYYFLIDKHHMSLLVCLLKDFICPVGLVILFGTFFSEHSNSLWTALAIASVAVVIIAAPIGVHYYGKKLFPYLLPQDMDDRIFIFSFDIDRQSANAMSEKAGELLAEQGFSPRIRNIVSLCIEEMVNLIGEKNGPGANQLTGECTLIMEEEGVRLILRDTGKIFDITDENAVIDSFRQYFVSSLIKVIDYKIYVATTGYNRNEFYFLEDRSAAGQKGCSNADDQ